MIQINLIDSNLIDIKSRSRINPDERWILCKFSWRYSNKLDIFCISDPVSAKLQPLRKKTLLNDFQYLYIDRLYKLNLKSRKFSHACSAGNKTIAGERYDY